MRGAFFLIFLVVLPPFFCLGEERCDASLADKKPTGIKVEGSVPEYRLRHDLSISEIRELEKEKEYDNAGRTLGFTSYETKNEVSFNIQFLHEKGGESGCAWVHDLTTFFNVTLVDIFVPSEYQPGTCPYEQVKAHEEQHVRILKETHAEFLENLRLMLKTPGAFHDSASPISASSADDAKSQISRELERALNDFIKDFSGTLAMRQREIDTPENYELIHSRCLDW